MYRDRYRLMKTVQTYKKLSLNQKSTYYHILCYFPIQFCVSLCIGCTGKRSGNSVKGLRKFLSSEGLCCLWWHSKGFDINRIRVALSVACPLLKRVTQRSTLASSTFCRGKIPLPVIQEEQVVSSGERIGTIYG